MASLNTVNSLLRDAKITLSSYDVNRIAEKTKPDDRFDYSLALANIAKCEGTREAIIEAINDTITLQCGSCMDKWIPLLDRHAYRDAGYPTYRHTLSMPKVNVPCPKCSTDHTHAQAVIDYMNETERGWCYVILYDFWCNSILTLPNYTAEDEAAGRERQFYPDPDKFSPKNLWGLELNPFLTEAQCDCLNWVQHPTPLTEPHPKPRPKQAMLVTAQAFIETGKRIAGVE